MEARISIKSTSDGEILSQVKAVGEMEISPSFAVVRYDEVAPGMENTVTELAIEPDKIVMKRTGGYQSEMVFVPNLTSDFLLKTPYGSVPLNIYSEKVKGTIGKKSVSVDLEYVVSTGGHSTKQHLCLYSFPKEK
jgi:uncharacterized beta-barrel protein YwiB (DUF1934 family)